MIMLRDASPDGRPDGSGTPTPSIVAINSTALPGSTPTSILYKFGMSPRLWGLAALVAGGGYFFYKKKLRR